MPPKIYGLPKLHKPQTLLRPIVSFIGAPSYKLSKYNYISDCYSPLAGRTSSHILNSKYFTGIMKEEHLELWTTFALRMTRASSRNVGRLYTEH